MQPKSPPDDAKPTNEELSDEALDEVSGGVLTDIAGHEISHLTTIDICGHELTHGIKRK